MRFWDRGLIIWPLWWPLLLSVILLHGLMLCAGSHFSFHIHRMGLVLFAGLCYLTGLWDASDEVRDALKNKYKSQRWERLPMLCEATTSIAVVVVECHCPACCHLGWCCMWLWLRSQILLRQLGLVLTALPLPKHCFVMSSTSGMESEALPLVVVSLWAVNAGAYFPAQEPWDEPGPPAAILRQALNPYPVWRVILGLGVLGCPRIGSSKELAFVEKGRKKKKSPVLL